MTQPKKMLLGVLLGAGLGVLANVLGAGSASLSWVVANVTYPAGQIFLRLLFMLVVPLLFAALVVGVAALELRQVGRVALRTLGYTVVVSGIAVVIGLVLVNVLEPGRGLSDELRAMAQTSALPKAATAVGDGSAVSLIIGIFTDNPVKAAASGDMIGWLVFSLIFGIGLSRTQGPAATRLGETIQGLYDVMMTLVDGVLRLAPIGVAALLFTATARLGFGLLLQLGAYVGVVLLALSLHMFVVYSVSLRVLSAWSPLAFFRAVRLAMVTAFSTASSTATLPTALKVAEENLRLPPSVARFVLTAGATMNQNGTALFEGVTVLFLAQLFGVELSMAQQGVVMLICILAGIGTAGVPAGSLPVIAMILGMFGIPVEGLGLIIGVDRFLDMCRTTVNVTGDLVAATYVARGEDHASATVTGAPVVG